MFPWIVGGIFALVAALSTIGGSDDVATDKVPGGEPGAKPPTKLKSKRPQGAQESFLAGQKAGREAREAELVIETKAKAERQAEIDSAVARAVKASGGSS